MNRRQALGTIVMGGAALTLLPACQSETLPTFTHFEVESKAYQMLDFLSELILPTNDLPLETPESTPEYVLRVVDECYIEEGRLLFVEGWNAYPDFVKENGSHNYKKWSVEEANNHLAQLQVLSEDNAIGYFFRETKNLTRDHFTSSPHYLYNYLDYQFIPGEYEGCAAV